MVPDIPAIAFVFSQLLRARLLATAYLFPKYLVQASCPKVGPELIEMKWGYGAAINGRKKWADFPVGTFTSKKSKMRHV